MRTFTNSIVLVLFGMLTACQQPAPQQVETGEVADAITYTFSAIEKNIPCKEGGQDMCLKIFIEKIDIEGGTSDNARQKIEKTLFNAISESGNSEEPAKSPEQIAENLQTEYTRIKEEMPDYKLPWDYQSEFEVYLNRGGLFAVELTNYSFTGGAHGTGFTYFYTFDTDNGNTLLLKDLLLPKKYDELHALAESQFRLTRDIDSTEGYEEAGFWFEDDLFRLNDNYKYSEDGLEVVFNPYEIAPFSEGEILLQFPYSAIEEFVKPEYRLIGNMP